jgi:hypothetical protein
MLYVVPWKSRLQGVHVSDVLANVRVFSRRDFNFYMPNHFKLLEDHQNIVATTFPFVTLRSVRLSQDERRVGNDIDCIGALK